MILAMSDEVTLRFTEKEMTWLAALATIRGRADAGDRRARQKMAQLARRVVLLKRQAARGNTGAARELLVLQESGILVRGQTLAMDEG